MVPLLAMLCYFLLTCTFFHFSIFPTSKLEHFFSYIFSSIMSKLFPQSQWKNGRWQLKTVDYADDQKEPEMQIGYPTDVKHVAHIGWDGPSANTPSWVYIYKYVPFINHFLSSFMPPQSLVINQRHAIRWWELYIREEDYDCDDHMICADEGV